MGWRGNKTSTEELASSVEASSAVIPLDLVTNSEL